METTSKGLGVSTLPDVNLRVFLLGSKVVKVLLPWGGARAFGHLFCPTQPSEVSGV